MTHLHSRIRPHSLLTFARSYMATLMFGVAVQAIKEGDVRGICYCRNCIA